MNKFVNVSNEVKKMDMEFNYGELQVVTGETFSINVEGEDADKIIIEENGDALRIYDERKSKRIKSKHFFFSKGVEVDSCEITITIPEDKSFDRVSAHTGAVEAHIDSLKTAILNLEMGVGEVEIDYLEVSNCGKISSGTGEVTVSDGCVNDMNMSFGVGEADLRIKMTGDSRISTGVGELNLVLHGTSSDYSINASKGIGACHIHGFDVSGNNTYGTGANNIKVSGGVGEITISLA